MHMLRRHPREWSPAAWCIVAGGLLASGLLVVLGVQPPSERPPSNAQLTAGAGQVQNVDVHYPVLHEDAIDQQIKHFAEKQTEKFSHAAKDKSDDPRTKFTLNYTIPHHGDQTISVVFVAKEEIAGKKPVTTKHRLVFDVVSGKKITTNDLFRNKEEASGVLANIFYDYFSVDKKAKLSPSQQLDFLNFNVKSIRDFLIYEDSLLFYLNPRNLAAKDRLQSIQIKKSVLTSILKDTYARVDTGRKLDTPPDKVGYTLVTLPVRHTPNVGGKRIALTFDDGPSVHTSRLLDTLARYRSKATFYVLGHLAQAYAGQLQRMVKEGHEIGNHTWMHPDLTLLDGNQLSQQIGDTQHAIAQVTGYTPKTLRPPYGSVNDAVTERVASLGLQIVLWSVDTNDWQAKDAQVVYDRIMGGAADGHVILLHDIYGSSVDAAIRAIPELLKQGYQLVTVSELYGY